MKGEMGPQLAKKTKQIYMREIDRFRSRFFSLHRHYPEEADPVLVQEYLDRCYPDFIQSKSVLRVHFAAIRKWLDLALTRELVFPAIEPDLPRILGVKEMQKLFSYTKKHPCGAMIRLIYESGIKLSEITKIMIQDIDFENGTIVLRDPFFRKYRETFLPGTMKYEIFRLAHGRGKTEYLFSLRENRRGSSRAISSRTVRQFLARAARDLELGEISVQTLRDSYAIHMINSGYDRQIIMKIMGFKHLRSVTRYLPFSDFPAIIPRSPIGE